MFSFSLLFMLLNTVEVYSNTVEVYGGILSTIMCEDSYCCLKCKAYNTNVVAFDSECRWNGEWAETQMCVNSKYYERRMYENRECSGLPSFKWTSGQCYPTEDGKSFYFQCYQKSLVGAVVHNISINGSNNEHDEWYIYTIGILIILLVFLCGWLCGYFLYKRRCCEKKYVEKKRIILETSYLRY